MKTFYGLNSFTRFSRRGTLYAATIGVFDGVHEGHRKIIESVKKEAKEINARTLLITFDPHPANKLYGKRKVPLLISLKHRLSLLDLEGIDCSLVLRFDKTLAKVSPEKFIKNLLKKIKIKRFVVGKNFYFGKNKKGSIKVLQGYAKKYGYKVKGVSPVKWRKKSISSTRIRKLILRGKIKEAEKLLSSPVTVLGTVVRGRRRGRFLGFPTANIDPHHEAIPPSGVYAVLVKYKKENILKTYGGILNIGFRPTFGTRDDYDREPSIEVHMFGFRNSIYGKELELIFLKRIRNERQFKNSTHLREQILKDQSYAKRLLRSKRKIIL